MAEDIRAFSWTAPGLLSIGTGPRRANGCHCVTAFAGIVGIVAQGPRAWRQELPRVYFVANGQERTAAGAGVAIWVRAVWPGDVAGRPVLS